MTGVTSYQVGTDEIAVLKRLGLDGALEGEIKVSCAGLANDLSTSNQTASRRLQALDEADLITRETVQDGQWLAITETGKRILHREYEEYRRLFTGGSHVTLEGTITNGMGEGRHYISLPGYMKQFEDRLGYSPFAGTLNIDLTTESTRKRGSMESFDPIPIDGWADEDRTYGGAVCYPVNIETGSGETYDTAHVIAPERTHHDDDHIEVIAPDKLREQLDLEDGDTLTLYVEEAL